MPTALTDNWLLELACHALTVPPPEPKPLEGSHLSGESFSALIHFLDLTIFYDKIFYDDEWSSTWDHLLSGDARHILSPVGLSREEKEEFRPYSEQQTSNCKHDSGLNDVVRGGAYFYLGVSNAMGIPYWPSPARADFLRENASLSAGPFFSLATKGYLEEHLRQIEEEVLRSLSVTSNNLRFMGLSTIVLANSNSRNDILRVALEIRDTREAREMRAWLSCMEEALAQGDVIKTARGAEDLKQVVDFVRRGLGLDSGSVGEVQLEVGLTPTITVGAAALRRIVNKITPRPLHITFLRRLLGNNLKHMNTAKHISRLFAVGRTPISFNSSVLIDVSASPRPPYGEPNKV